MVKRLELAEISSFVQRVWTRLCESGAVPAYHRPVKNLDHLIALWEGFTGNGVGAIYGLEDAAGVPAGFLAGIMAPDFLSGEPQGIEVLWVVHPDARKNGTAFGLLEMFEADVKRSGGKLMVVGVTAEGPRALRRVYRRLGYKPDGETFRKEL